MPDNHYAIVIGLQSYPLLGDPPPSDLQGPGADAAAVREWLADPKGGGLPDKNIRTILSMGDDWKSPPSAAPTTDQVESAFFWLDGLASANNDGKVGERFYMYVSGHGCAKSRREACLLTGNASAKTVKANICPIAWIDWLRDANYFREFVLWMDCCTARQVFAIPSAAPLNPVHVQTAPGSAFVAVAARHGLKALEKAIPEDGGRWHGVFTWNLLQGLRGAATDEYNNVTSQSLSKWLKHAQLDWLNSTERADPDNATEPDFVENDTLIFAHDVKPIEFDVTLTVKGAAGETKVALWGGRPPTLIADATIKPEGSLFKLSPGFYLASSETGLRHGFAVTRSSTIELDEHGPAPTPSGGSFSLKIDPGNIAVEVQLFDSNFVLVQKCTGALLAPQLQCGLYKIHLQDGRKIIEKVVLLDRNWPPPVEAGLESVAATPPANMLPQFPPITSAAPLPSTETTHEYHQSAVRDAESRKDIDIGSGAELTIISRIYSSGVQTDIHQSPWRDVKIFSGERQIADLETDGQADTAADPIVTCTLSLPPGVYELRYPLNREIHVAQTLVLPPGGWRLEAYLLRYSKDVWARPVVTLLMRRIGAAWGTDEDLTVQKALVALADKRIVTEGEFIDSLCDRYDDPIAAIVGAHLLHIASKQNGEIRPKRLNGVIARLRQMVGDRHPDVEALSLFCPDESLRAKSPVEAAPMFERSWSLLIGESYDASDLVPLELWKKVNATVFAPPYFCWTTDKALKEEALTAQAKNFAGVRAIETAATEQGYFARLRSWTQRLIAGKSALKAIEQQNWLKSRLSDRAKSLGLPAEALKAITDAQKNKSSDS